MTNGKKIEKSVDIPLKGTQPSSPGQVQVTQGNVSIVTVQLLNDVSIKLSKIIEILEKNVG